MTKKKKTPSSLHKGSKPISEKPRKSGGNRMILWGAVAAAILLIVVLVAVALLNQPKVSTASPSGVSVAERVNQPVERNVIGDPAAPVLIEAYEDFQCPHCQRFTPTIFINGQQYQGDFTPEMFKAAVEAALEASS